MSEEEAKLIVLQCIGDGRIKVMDAQTRYGGRVKIHSREASDAFNMHLQDLILNGLVEYTTMCGSADDMIDEVWLTEKGRSAQEENRIS